jgi:sortase A
VSAPTTTIAPPGSTRRSAPDPALGGGDPPAPSWLVALAVGWTVSVLLAVVLVLVGLGPIFAQRDQRALLDGYRLDIEQASFAGSGLGAGDGIALAPSPGDPVAVLEVPSIELQAVVVEGAGSSQTSQGPGHVPGTAGPGQPGNSVVVGRAHAFGAPFADLSGLAPGDAMVVTTTQGASVYEVDRVEDVSVVDGSEADSGGALPTALGSSGDEAGDAPSITVDELYGPSDDDQLTLFTSASWVPWNGDRATVVVATMQTVPFEPTPQNGRDSVDAGRGFDLATWPGLVLGLLAFGVVAIVAAVLYRRSARPVAYLLTIGPFLAACVLLAEAISATLPAWL